MDTKSTDTGTGTAHMANHTVITTVVIMDQKTMIHMASHTTVDHMDHMDHMDHRARIARMAPAMAAMATKLPRYQIRLL